MSIRQLLEKINIFKPSSEKGGEVVSYDSQGRVEKNSLFQKLFLSIIIILVTSLSFGLGRLSVVGEREPIRIEYPEEKQASYGASDPNLTTNNLQPTTKLNQAANVIESTRQTGQTMVNSNEVVASKNGVRYHYLHCSGAKQIKAENRIVFSSPTAAEDAGYTLAANCKPR